MILNPSSKQYTVDSTNSNVTFHVNNCPILESSPINLQNIVESNSYEYVSTYVRLLTTLHNTHLHKLGWM